MYKPHIGLSLTSYKAIARIYNTTYSEKIAEKIVHHTCWDGLDSCLRRNAFLLFIGDKDRKLAAMRRSGSAINK